MFPWPRRKRSRAVVFGILLIFCLDYGWIQGRLLLWWWMIDTDDDPTATSSSTTGTFLQASKQMKLGKEKSKPFQQPNPQDAAPSSQSSWIHCVGDNFLPSAWIYRSCQYRNICRDAMGTWVVYPSLAAQMLEESWQQGQQQPQGQQLNTRNVLSEYARHSTSWNHNQTTVSPIVTTPYAIRKHKYAWTPQVRWSIQNGPYSEGGGGNGPMPPAPPIVSEEDGIGIPIHVQYSNSNEKHGNMMELLTQVLLPIYNLLGLFGWEQESKTVRIYLLNEHECNKDCQEWLQFGLEELMGYTLMLDSRNDDRDKEQQYRHCPFCLPRAAAGIGLLSGHGLSKRGYHAKDYTETKAMMHNVGRGATLWEFRTAILTHHGRAWAAIDPSIDRMERVHAVLAFPRQASHDARADDSWATTVTQSILEAFPKTKSSDYTVNILEDVPNKDHHQGRSSTLYKLIYAARSANVWIAPADEPELTWPALFLPRGATLALLYNPTSSPKRRPNEPRQTAGATAGREKSHPVYPDFAWWNHVSHLQVHWLALPENNNPNDSNWTSLVSILQQIIQSQRKTTNDATSNSVGDGMFNSHYRVNLATNPSSSLPPSQFHCIGENWEWDAHNYRSCQMQNLCFHIPTKQFFRHAPTPGSPQDLLSKLLVVSTRSTDSLSTLTGNNDNKFGVVMGQSIRRGYGDPWFPLLEDAINTTDSSAGNSNSTMYYSLPSNVVWLPYFAEVPNANNPGHLLWDFFFPLYTLMELFYGPRGKQSEEDYPRLLLTNLDTDCVSSNPQGNACHKLTRKFLPLLGVNPDAWKNSQESHLDLQDPVGQTMVEPETPWVCAAESLMGIGMLTDHGVKKHGQLLEDYQTVRNTGRGMAFWRFRNFMLQNAESLSNTPFPNAACTSSQPPLTITFSVHSSNNPSRKRDFVSQIELLRARYPLRLVRVQAVQLDNLSLREQLQVVQASSIFVSVIGGSASTAMFMERNSGLVLYFNDIDDFVKGQHGPTKMPSMLDWDFWNHASYLRVHWLPLSNMDDPDSLALFGKLMDNELEIVASSLQNKCPK